jgi:hypothetical protein
MRKEIEKINKSRKNKKQKKNNQKMKIILDIKIKLYKIH